MLYKFMNYLFSGRKKRQIAVWGGGLHRLKSKVAVLRKHSFVQTIRAMVSSLVSAIK